MLYNQWANVVRWEMRPRLFLRTTEFLWQEGHTAHETHDDAWEEALRMLEVYRQVAEDVMAMPVHMGRKTAAERFPGAVETLCIEALMRDAKALQSGTSHYLGTNFAEAYGVTFLGRDGEEHHAFATSWGVSTRLVGGLIMAHGDDKGLRLPPKVAPVQVVIVPIFRNDDERARVLEATARMAEEWRAAGLRVKIDDRDDLRPGFKFADHELRGVPVRVEVGPRDLDASQVTMARRDGGDKQAVPIEAATAWLTSAMDDIQRALFDDAVAFRDANTHEAATYEELRAALLDAGGFVTGGWCGSPECEAKVKADTKATIRFLPLETRGPGCAVRGLRPAGHRARDLGHRLLSFRKRMGRPSAALSIPPHVDGYVCRLIHAPPGPV